MVQKSLEKARIICNPERTALFNRTKREKIHSKKQLRATSKRRQCVREMWLFIDGRTIAERQITVNGYLYENIR